MRQRKIKNIDQRISEHHKYLVDNPVDMKGKWLQGFENENPVFAEFGCGRGQFIMAMAKQHPDRNYIAFECRGSIVLRALEKATEENPANVVIVNENIIDVNEYFEENELSGVYLNFSDPWPKKRHAKRRLTSGRFLDGYQRVLRAGGCIEFKTDNDDLFSYTIDEIKKSNMKILESTCDLHNTDLDAKYVTTEYEDKFRRGGKKINYCKMIVE